MSWRYSGQTLSNITQLLSKPDTTVEMILDEPALSTALRNNLQALNAFFIDNPENNAHLIDLALTDIVPNTRLPAKTIRCAVQVLTSSSTIINKNDLLYERLIDFPNTEYAQKQKCCAHYCQIIENIARFNSGQSLSRITTLRDFLMKRMSNVALCELFVVLATDHHDNWQVKDTTINEMISDPNSPDNFYYIRAIDNMTKTKQKVNRMLFRCICNLETVKRLIAIAKNDNLRPIICVEAFMLLERIINEMSPNDELKNIIETEAASYNFALERPESVTAAALRVFITKDDSVILKIFANTGTYFRKGVIRSLTNMPQADLMAIFQRTDLVKLFMTEFPKSIHNSHLIPLGELINSNAAETEGWSDFYANTFKTRADKISCQFGGERPPSMMSDNEEDEDDSDGFAVTQPACDDVDTEQLFSSSDSSSDSDGEDGFIPKLPKNLSSSDDSDSDSDSDGDELRFKLKGDSALKSDSDDSDDVFGLSKPKPSLSLNQGSDSDSSSDSDDLTAKPVMQGLPPFPGTSMAPPVLPNPVLPESTELPQLPTDKVSSGLPPFPGLPAFPKAVESSDSDSDDMPIRKTPGEVKVPPPFPGSEVKVTLPPFPMPSQGRMDRKDSLGELPQFGNEKEIDLPPFPKAENSLEIPSAAQDLPPIPNPVSFELPQGGIVDIPALKSDDEDQNAEIPSVSEPLAAAVDEPAKEGTQ